MCKEILVGTIRTAYISGDCFYAHACKWYIDDDIREDGTFWNYNLGIRYKVLENNGKWISFQRVLTNDDEIYDYCIEKLKKIKELEKSLEVIDEKYITEARKRLGDK